MSHTHFTLEDRSRIQFGLEAGLSHRAVAEELGVSHGAISQEITRNSVTVEYLTTSRVNKPRILTLDLRTRRGKGEVPEKLAAQERWKQRLARFARGQPSYDAEVAQTLYLVRRTTASQGNLKLLDDNPLAKRISERLLSNEKGSPEQIAADLRKENVVVCAQTIYDWIRRSSQSKELTKRLRRRGRRYRYAHETALRWNKTKDKRSIHSRPAVIEKLIRYGDLEGDTIFGSDTKDRILTHVDRATGLLSMSLVLGYDSQTIHQQTLEDVRRVFGSGVRTITYDNGSEFATWKRTEEALHATVYFADPYRSSQRGRNENTNGLVRDYYPKGYDFKKITEQELRKIETILNNRSRKRYNWMNPFEQRELLLARS
jgi:IS30 family transposase